MLFRVGILLSQMSQEGTRGMKVSRAGLVALGEVILTLASVPLAKTMTSPMSGHPLASVCSITQMSARARSWLGEEEEKKGRVKPPSGQKNCNPELRFVSRHVGIVPPHLRYLLASK